MGKEIPLSTIEKVWNSIKKELKEKGHKTDFPMPTISSAFILPEKDYLELARFFKKEKKRLGVKRTTSTIEYGYEVDMEETCGFCVFFPKWRGWVVYLRGCERCDEEEDLRHELKHIWEVKLCLKYGTLTRE